MLKCLISLLVTLTCVYSFADDPSGAGKASSSPAAEGKPAPEATKVDELITNANLRAYSGSTSRWSLSNSITYDGGTVSSPFAEARPNIAGASATSVDTDINDQLSIKLSLNPLDSILLGVGIRKMAPFTGSGPSAGFYAGGGKDMDIFDPSLTLQRVYKFLSIQAVAQIQYTHYTREDIRSTDGGDLGQNLTFDQENIYEIGRFSIGGSIGFGGNLPTEYGPDFSRYQFWFLPYVEYKLSDKFNLRTVANIWYYEIYALGGLIRDTYTESVGLGCSISRDFFLYPNVQFLPSNTQKGLTNVGLTATINLF